MSAWVASAPSFVADVSLSTSLSVPLSVCCAVLDAVASVALVDSEPLVESEAVGVLVPVAPGTSSLAAVTLGCADDAASTPPLLGKRANRDRRRREGERHGHRQHASCELVHDVHPSCFADNNTT